MTITEILALVIQASILTVVFSFGLRATPKDAFCLLKQPGLLLRSFLSMNVVMFIFAVLAALVFDLHPAVRVGLIALSLSPVPPILPGKQTKAGGSIDYAIGLLVTMSVLALLVVPIGVAIAGEISGTGARMPMLKVVPVILITVILPLAAGMLARYFHPALAERSARWVQIAATLMLVLTAIPEIVAKWNVFSSMIGNGVLPALVLFSVIGLGVGHVFGGPEEDDRTVLALATSARHPGVALAIVKLNFPDQGEVVAVVLWSLIVASLVALPYVNWRKRVHEKVQPSGPPQWPITRYAARHGRID